MPRAVQSKEGAIIAFFRTQPIEVAQVVHRLAGEELKLRLQRSTEAKARAKQAAPRPDAAALALSRPAPATAPKKKAKKKKAAKRPAAPAAEPIYDESDLNTPD